MDKPDFNHLPTRLGVYTLTRHIGSMQATELYLATQSHVERGVIVEVLRPGIAGKEVDFFLSMARAKVAAHLPHVCQVFESMVSGDVWYITQELPKGKSLARVQQEARNLSPTQVCAVIEAAAALYIAGAEAGVALGGLMPFAVYLRGEQMVEFLSPVVSGSHTEVAVATQMETLAATLQPLLPTGGVPGQSRVATLVDWLAHGYEGNRLDWPTIANTAATVREQLAPTLKREHVAGLSGKTRGSFMREFKRNRRKMLRTCIYAGIALAGIVGCFVAGILCAPDSVPSLPANDGSRIACMGKNGSLYVAATPVSLQEYNHFLAVMQDESQFSVDALRDLTRDVPAEHVSFKPVDWDLQWKAAKQGGKYRGQQLSPDSPVRGVCYWDALVYARFRKAELPDAALLQTARNACATPPAVAEWTTDTYAGTELYKSGRVLLPAGWATYPVIAPDAATRNPDYGFRLVYPSSSDKNS